jgi:hypothetical protein
MERSPTSNKFPHSHFRSHFMQAITRQLLHSKLAGVLPTLYIRQLSTIERMMIHFFRHCVIIHKSSTTLSLICTHQGERNDEHESGKAEPKEENVFNDVSQPLKFFGVQNRMFD